MEVNPNLSQSSDANVSSVQRPGEYLSQIRLQKNIALEQVSKDLAIPMKTMLALEKDDYKVLPEATFIRGFLRAYAKYLQVDAQELIRHFDQIYTEITGQATENVLSNSPLQVKGRLAKSKNTGSTGLSTAWLKRLGYLLGVVIIVAVIAVIFQQIQKLKAENKSNEPRVEVLDLAGKKASTTPTQPSKNTATPAGDRLTLEFKRPTAVHIEDANGKVLATGRQANRLELDGKSPFKIRIDDATVVSLRLNDEAIDLSKRMVNGKVDFRLAR